MKNFTKKLMTLLVASFVFILVACTPSKEKEVTKDEDKESIVITDVLGREVTLDKPMEKVIIQGSGSGGPFITMMALDKDNFHTKIAAMDDGVREHRNDLYSRLVAAIPELDEIPRVTNFSSNDFSIEELTKIEADGIIVPVGFKAQIEEIEKKIDLPVLFVDYHSEQLENHLLSNEIIAKATGLDGNLDKLNTFYKDRIDLVAEKVKSAKAQPSVYVELGYEGEKEYSNSYGKDMMWGKIIEDVGGNNIAKEVLDDKEAVALSPEFVLSKDPEIIVLTGAFWEEKPDSLKLGFDVTEKDVQAKLEKFETREGWDSLSAFKNKEVYAICHSLARDVTDFYSFLSLAKAFHPEEFKDVDPQKELEDFYKEFMPIELEGTWFYKYQ